MNIISKLIMLIVKCIFPNSFVNIMLDKVARCKNVLVKNKDLYIFWRILFFPVNVVIELILCIPKIILILIFNKNQYGKIVYCVKEFYKDIVGKNMSLLFALRRQKLRIELFICGREKRKSYGNKNEDKIFFVIKPYYFIKTNELLIYPQHLLYYYYIVLQKISYAVSKGYYPIVDFENYDGLLYFAEEDGVDGNKNAWEYFWKQPCDYSLDEVYKSKNVIIATRNSEDYGFIPPTIMKKPFDKYAEDLKNKCSRYISYTELNSKTKKYTDEWQRKLFPKNSKILGVVYRSTSYGSEGTCSGNHPVQPSLVELVKQVKKYLKEWGMEYVYFVNEEEKNIEYMQSIFGNKVIILPRKRYKNFHEFTPEDPNPLYVKGQRYNTNLSYLTEIVLLSKCNGLLGAMSSGTRAAIIWNSGEYEHIKIIDLGLW